MSSPLPSPPTSRRQSINLQNLDTEETSGKALLKLLRLNYNRICADCRAPLVESHNIWTSLSSPTSPLPHAVFICQPCCVSHRNLSSTCRVKSVHQSLWSTNEVQLLRDYGNFKTNLIFERHIPEAWKATSSDYGARKNNNRRRRKTKNRGSGDENNDLTSGSDSDTSIEGTGSPNHGLYGEEYKDEGGEERKVDGLRRNGGRLPTRNSTAEERVLFIRAKYESCAFVFPVGPLTNAIMINKVKKDTGKDGEWKHQHQSQFAQVPTRLVDYFCVISTEGKLERDSSNKHQPLHSLKELSGVAFVPEVIDQYPGNNPSSPLQSHVASFVFPEPLTPSTREKAPQFYTFVLTSETGLRMYGASLMVWEDVESKTVLDWIRNSDYDGKLPPWFPSPDAQIDANDEAVPEILFMPKALCVLSHYPFHNAWRTFLQQLYRISLSLAPLPIERYIANFTVELPLPPRGQVEVKFGYIDKACSIGRPPSNKLPGTDFSYRPLFGCLSISNILVVFGYLLTEARVALCSSHYSILTPVSESLLSLIFPFVWQGAYIPIMPSAMTDILDAPVPFLVGLHSKYLKATKPEHRPKGVIFVDLDDDVVHLGFDDEGRHKRVCTRMPEREVGKLKDKLLEWGNSAYLNHPGVGGRITTGNNEVLPFSMREAYAEGEELTANPDGTGTGRSSGEDSFRKPRRGSLGKKQVNFRRDVLEKADLAFPNNEHLLPINTFATEQGMVLRKGKGGSGMSSEGIRGMRGAGVQELNSKSLIDTMSDETLSSNEKFSAREIRGAFLRFFVSVFRHYDKHTNPSTPTKPFNMEGFLSDSKWLADAGEWVRMVVGSQMFERFIEERISNPNQPEIRFFNESIIQKLNRSAKSSLSTAKKKETPFLSDQSDVVSETFNPPPPSNWGLPDDGRTYSYNCFPRLEKNFFGNVRAPRQLTRVPEQQRSVNETKHAAMMQTLMKGDSAQKLGLSGGPGNAPPGVQFLPQRPKKDLEWALHLLVYGENLMLKGSTRQQPKSSATASLKEANTLIMNKKQEQDSVVGTILIVQKHWRSKLPRNTYRKMREAAKFIQKFYRHVTTLRMYREVYQDVLKVVKTVQKVFRGWKGRNAAFNRYRSIVTVQKIVRGRLITNKLKKDNWAATIVQAAERGRRCRLAFALVRDLVVCAQAAVRGWFKRKIAIINRKARLKEYREQIFELWRRANTPLAYRSKFWLLFDGSGFLHVAVHEDELEKLWKDLGVFKGKEDSWLHKQYSTLESNLSEDSGDGIQLKPMSNSERTSTDFVGILNNGMGVRGGVPFYKKFLWVQSRSESSPDSSPPTPLFPAELSLAKKPPGIDGRHLQVSLDRLRLERTQIYEKMKYQNSDTTKAAYFSMFKLKDGSKKRKQKLISSLWEDLSNAFESAQVVLGVESDGDMEGGGAGGAWVANKLEQRIKHDLLSTVKACITSIQMLKEQGRQMNKYEKYTRFGSTMGASPRKQSGLNSTVSDGTGMDSAVAVSIEEAKQWNMKRNCIIANMMSVSNSGKDDDDEKEFDEDTSDEEGGGGGGEGGEGGGGEDDGSLSLSDTSEFTVDSTDVGGGGRGGGGGDKGGVEVTVTSVSTVTVEGGDIDEALSTNIRNVGK